MGDQMKDARILLENLRLGKIAFKWTVVTRISTVGIEAYESLHAGHAITVAKMYDAPDSTIEGVCFVVEKNMVVRIPPEVAGPMWREAKAVVGGTETVRVVLPKELQTAEAVNSTDERFAVDIEEKDKALVVEHHAELAALNVPPAVRKRILMETFSMGVRYGSGESGRKP